MTMNNSKKPDFKERYLELASDGKHRTVKMIREALYLPSTSNVGLMLANLQMDLAGDRGEIRIRRTTLRSESHQQLWWMEKKKVTNCQTNL